MLYFDNPHYLSVVFYLLCGHALADYVLQTERMVVSKHPRLKKNSRSCVAEYGPWWWWMTAHALINGMMVGLVTHWWLLGVAETAVHWGADYQKCRGRIDVWQDQAIHVASKFLWACWG